MCHFLCLLGILNLNARTLKKRSQPLHFIHYSHSSDALYQGPSASFQNNDSGAFCAEGSPKTTERGRLDKHRTEQAPYDPSRSSSSSRPGSSRQRRSRRRPRRCGTDGGGLRHRQEKEDASSQWTITSLKTHLTNLPPAPPAKTIAMPAPSLTLWFLIDYRLMENICALDAYDGITHAGFILELFLNEISHKIRCKTRTNNLIVNA